MGIAVAIAGSGASSLPARISARTSAGEMRSISYNTPSLQTISYLLPQDGLLPGGLYGLGGGHKGEAYSLTGTQLRQRGQVSGDDCCNLA